LFGESSEAKRGQRTSTAVLNGSNHEPMTRHLPCHHAHSIAVRCQQEHDQRAVRFHCIDCLIDGLHTARLKGK
jgi:hypothetical protein